MNKTRLFASAAIALSVLGASNANAQEYVCDAETFTQDVATFGEVTEDFESYAYAHHNLYGGASVTVGDFAFSDGELELGGDAIHYGSLTMRPLVPMSSIAFTYGAQWFGPTEITIVLSDGSERVFVPVLQPTGPYGYWEVGDFGYCTGDPSLAITELRFYGPDGFIDDIAGVSAPACDDLDGDGFTTCDADCDDGDATSYPGALEICDGVDNSCDGLVDISPFVPEVCDQGCDESSLQETILGLGLHGGTETALLAKLDAAAANADAGNITAAINNLNAMINQVEAQRGKKISEEDADDLLACVGAVLADL